jgi:hypothetical protein
LRLRGDRRGVTVLEDALQISDGGFDGLLVASRDLVAVFLNLLFGGVDQGFALVLGFDVLTLRLVFAACSSASFTMRLMSSSLRPPDGWMRIVLLFVGRLILGADGDDAVRVDVERDFDLRHAAR